MMVELTIKKIKMDAPVNWKVSVSWKRGKNAQYEQSPVVTLGPDKTEVELNHEINRNTTFYTNDNGKTYERKTCDFYIYGRNDQTKDRVKLIGTATKLNMTPFVGKKSVQARVSFPEAKV